MTGKRKASDDAPPLPRPPPPQRLRREDGYDDGNSTVRTEDSASSGGMCPDDDGYSSTGAGNVSGDSSGRDERAGAVANMILGLNIHPQNQVPDGADELDVADGQHADAEGQPLAPPPSPPSSTASEVSDQSVPETPLAQEMLVPAADPVMCLGCGRQPASLRQEPVEHDCLCLPCRSNPLGGPHCEYCDAPRH